MTATLPQRITLSAQVLIQELDGESVLLDLATERYYGLNDVGTRIWQLLASSGDPQAVYENLISEYDAPADQLRQDLVALLERLNQAGLVSSEPAEGAKR